MRSASDIRSQARDMERDAREIEELEKAIQFLVDHEDKPTCEVFFPGFKHDGQKAAEAVASWVLDHWETRRQTLLEDFRSRVTELKERWA
uniref:Uncharacterized protein n=1 Tax=Dinoroseobacter phage vB_DshS_R26L TaxID=3161158 RepID=A0AAU7VGA7_9CAUD